MENVYQGIPIVLFCCLGFYYAYKCSLAGKYTYALSLVVLCGLVLRSYTSMDMFLHAWDERYHALVAKNMLQHFLVPTLYNNPVQRYDYTSWASNSIWLHKQPMTLWLIAISLKCFGINEFAVRIPSIIMSTIGIKLIYDITKFLADKRSALLTAFLFSIQGFIIELTAGRDATDHVDIAFLFFILLAVWCAVQYARSSKWIYNPLTGICIGLAMLCKWLPALIVLPIWCILASAFKKDNYKLISTNLLDILVFAACIALPWQLYILHTFPKEAMWEYRFNQRHIGEALEGHNENFFYYFESLRIRYGELIYLPVLWYTYKTIQKKQPANVLMSVWFWVVILFFSFAKTKMPGFIIIASPAILFMSASFFFMIKDSKQANTGLMYLSRVIMFGLIALPIRYTIERVKPFTDMDRDPAWAQALRSLQHGRFDADKVILFNCPHPIEAMFYLHCTAYDNMPDSTLKTALITKGYDVEVFK